MLVIEPAQNLGLAFDASVVIRIAGHFEDEPCGLVSRTSLHEEGHRCRA
jgi:hypothetical protein